jgi:hypothetical protein
MVKYLPLLALTLLPLPAMAVGNDGNISQVGIASPSMNFKNTGATLLMTTENGTRSFHVTGVTIQSVAASAITIAATMSIGTNSSFYNNIVASTLLTGLTAVSTDYPVSLITAIGAIPANTGIYANVGTAATGTSQTGNIVILGYYQ